MAALGWILIGPLAAVGARRILLVGAALLSRRQGLADAVPTVLVAVVQRLYAADPNWGCRAGILCPEDLPIRGLRFEFAWPRTVLRG